MRTFWIGLVLSAVGCGTTGGGIVTFTARAGGPQDANGALEFDTGTDATSFHVSLTRACFHIGAVYLNMAQPISGSQAEPCAITDGTYIGEAFGNGVSDGSCENAVDLLSSDVTPFPTLGEGTANHAVYAEVWLSGGDVNAQNDNTTIFSVAGTATRGPVSWPFKSSVTIGANRATQTELASAPGTNPICKQRIVTPIFVDLSLTNGGTLDTRIDPRVMFFNVDFSQLSADSDGTYVIPDDSSNLGNDFFNGVKSSGVYQFTWTDK